MMEDTVEGTEMVVEQVSGEAETLAMVEDMAQAWVAREAGEVSKVDREAGVKEVELRHGEGLRVEVEAPGVMQVCNIQTYNFMTPLQQNYHLGGRGGGRGGGKMRGRGGMGGGRGRGAPRQGPY